MKVRMTFFCLAVLVASTAMQAAEIAPPMPYGSIPSERQLQWHELEFYGFLHFTINTFTDKEWGYGDESPQMFHPTSFDANQIVSTAKRSGMTGLILTCKHHDGFCLWPSKFTEHSVKNSPWKGGQGDVVREISDACREHGLKFGVYLSPWDRNHAEYGRPAYVEYYRNQLRELLTDYGPVFVVWLDGANGGSGYYGGAREERFIDRSTYYDWDPTIALIRQLQPNASVFSDAGPDIRWVGNEKGIAGDPCWATYTPHTKEGETKLAAGTTRHEEGVNGHRNGKFWMPAEADVSIRPGWFYHESENDQVRSPENLVDLYYASVGRGASLLLNLPPDRRGLIHENDVASLQAFRRTLDTTFHTNLAEGARVEASNLRGGDEAFSAKNLLDRQRNTYWATDDGVTAPSVTLHLGKPVTFNVVSLREFLPLGQRVDTWALDQWEVDKWTEFAKGEAIGSRRLWRGKSITTERVRLRLKGPVGPAISEFSLWAYPRTRMETSSGRESRHHKTVLGRAVNVDPTDN